MSKIRTFSSLSTLSLIGLSSLLFACGGGGGGSKSTPATSNSSAAATSSVANNSSSSSSASSVAANPVFDPVAGLYDASVINASNLKDENYLYIDGQGKITAYNYLADAVDLGDNCYRVATANDFNFKISGKTLTHNAAAQTFTVDVDGKNLVLETSNNAISRINYDFFSSGGLSINNPNLKLRVTRNRIDSPSIEDIQKSICK